MPWLSVNQTRLAKLNAVPTPLLALEVQRGVIPGQPGADCVSVSVAVSVSAIVVRAPSQADQGEPRLRIDLLAEVLRRLDEDHLERRPDVRLIRWPPLVEPSDRPMTTWAWIVGSSSFSATSPRSERTSTCSWTGIFR